MAKLATGLDYAWAPHPDETRLKSLGYTFVSRYLSWLPNGKVVTAAEIKKLHDNGVAVSLNWEYDIDDAQSGGPGGTKNATEAVKQAKNLKYPAGSTIYFSVDQDTTASGAVGAYLAAAKKVVNAAGYRMGAYGGYRLIKTAFDSGVIEDGWQTYAWSGGQWDARANMRQVKNGVNVLGADTDVNEQHGTVHIWAPGAPNTPPTPPTVPPGPSTPHDKAYNVGFNSAFNLGFQNGFQAGYKAKRGK